jgi:hypothetical protein
MRWRNRGRWPGLGPTRSSGATRGVGIDAEILLLAPKFPDGSLDYTIAIDCVIDPRVDLIASLTLACAPSGTGEMQISDLIVRGDTLAFTATGGQPGRRHTLKYVVTMTDGRVFPFVRRQNVTPVLPTDQAQAIPSQDFGAALTWTFRPSLNFTEPRNAIALMLGWI